MVTCEPVSNRQINHVPFIFVCAVLLVPMSPFGNLHRWEVDCGGNTFMGHCFTAVCCYTATSQWSGVKEEVTSPNLIFIL